MIHKPTFVEIMFLGIILICASFLLPVKAKPNDRPYIILFENPTEEDFEHCRADFPNCMDVMATRDWLKYHLENGEK